MSKARIADWSDLQIVLAVARSSSFQAAAMALEINQSTVGRRVQRLEAALGTKIFDRQLGGMRLSHAGRALFEEAQMMEAVAQGIEAKLSGFDTGLSGTLTISVPEGLGYLWLINALADFQAVHPNITIEVITDRQGLNLLHRDADVSIVLSRPTEARLVALKVAEVSHALFAAQSYVDLHGLPRSFDDLKMHRLVEYLPYRLSDGAADCAGETLSSTQVTFRVDSASMLLSALRAGVGIGLLPVFYEITASDLIRLPVATGSCVNIWIVSHEETNQSRRTRLLIDHLKSRFITDRVTWFSRPI